VCNELWLVHGVRCVPFEGDLTAYAQWSAAQRHARPQEEPATPVHSTTTVAPIVDRAEQRRLAAQWRAQTRPLRQAIEKLEQQLQHAQQRLRSLEQELGDAALYEASQKSQLLQRLTEQTELNRQCADWEDQLLNHMLELESLEAQAPQA
jgi:ATP-binding cassette subfamily F protein 3